jgi:superfamily I DNA/RNA helicase
MDEEFESSSINEFDLPTISDEQQLIVDAIKSNKNVIVDAIAGSGKTTTICHIANSLPKKRILLLTYNKRLKCETTKTLRKFGITNVYTSNYHSFCYNKYVCGDNTDQIILNAVNTYNNDETRFNYDIIAIDEAQDLTELYVKFIKMIIKHNKNLPTMCILGDVRQTIYTFNGADPRFLLFADKIFNGYVYRSVSLTDSVILCQNLLTNVYLNKILSHLMAKMVIDQGICFVIHLAMCRLTNYWDIIW